MSLRFRTWRQAYTYALCRAEETKVAWAVGKRPHPAHSEKPWIAIQTSWRL